MKTLFVLMLMALPTLASAESTPLPNIDSLWNYDEPAQTEGKFRSLLPMAQNSGDTTYLIELMTQIARTLGLQQKFDQANQLLDSANELLPAAGERAWVRYELERGRVFNSSQKPADALPLFEEAWNRASDARFDPLAIDAAHMCAIASSDADQKLGWNLKALAIAEYSSDLNAQRWLGSLYNNMGWDYFQAKKYDTALDLFQKAVVYRERLGQPKEIRIAKWSVAKTLRMLGRVDSALAMQRRLEKEWNASGERQDGYVYEEIAECLLTLNHATEATLYFAKAYEYLSKDPWLPRDEPERLARLKKLGEVK